MNSSADAFAFQKFRQRVTPLGPDDVHVINRSGPRSFRRNFYNVLQTIVVPRRDVSPMLV